MYDIIIIIIKEIWTTVKLLFLKKSRLLSSYYY